MRREARGEHGVEIARLSRLSGGFAAPTRSRSVRGRAERSRCRPRWRPSPVPFSERCHFDDIPEDCRSGSGLPYRLRYQLAWNYDLCRAVTAVTMPALADEEFLKFVQNQLAQFQIPPQKICFEIKETAATLKLSRAIGFIAILKKQGCRFALDDFGSGFSSFAYL